MRKSDLITNIRLRRARVSDLFPQALVHCIQEGREPRSEEFLEVVGKLRDEAEGGGLLDHEVNVLARVALRGCELLGLPSAKEVARFV